MFSALQGKRSRTITSGQYSAVQKERILIVEEKMESRDDSLSRMLQEGGYEVIESPDGLSGLEQVRTKNPDLVFFDLVTSGIDVFRVCKAIKSDPSLKKISVIITCSKGSKEDIIRSLESGANDYMVRPVEVHELLLRVRSALRERQILKQLERDRRNLMAISDIGNAMTSSPDSQEVFYSIIRNISKVADVSRGSILRIDEKEDKAYIVATNENLDDAELVVDLQEYPGILKAMETKDIVVLEDNDGSPVLESEPRDVSVLRHHSVLLLPIIRKQNVIGIILLRTDRRETSFGEEDIEYCQIVANAAAKALISASLFESMELANIQLAKMATTDGLTGLINHKFFYRRLDQAFKRARNDQGPLSVIMLDVDRFKKINDTLGHKTGDDVLKELAFVLKEETRKTDIVARYGGDEFIILLPGTDYESAQLEAERLRSAIASRHFRALKGSNIRVSMGISTCPDSRVSKADDLVKIADDELYAMKAERKNPRSGSPRNVKGRIRSLKRALNGIRSLLLTS